MALLVHKSTAQYTTPPDNLDSVVLAVNAMRAAQVSTNVHRDASEVAAVGFSTLSGATDSGGPHDTAMMAAAEECRIKMLEHYDDVDTVEYPTQPGKFGCAHKGAWARATVAALAPATTTTIAATNAAAMAVDWNSHMLDTGAHDNADSGTTAVAQTTTATYANTQTCLNQLKTAMNAHKVLALSGKSLRRVPF